MLLYFAFVILFFFCSFGWLLRFDTFPVLFDWDTLFMVVIFGFLFLLAAGMLKDFKNAFQIAIFHKKETNISKLKRATDAIELEIRGQILSALFILCGVTVKILGKIAYEEETLANVFPELPTILLHSVYVVVLIILLLPVKYRLRNILADYLSKIDD